MIVALFNIFVRLDDKQAIVDAIIQMAHRLHMKVIAEGVEQCATSKITRKMDCDIIQGYYYSVNHLPMDELLDLLSFGKLSIKKGNK